MTSAPNRGVRRKGEALKRSALELLPKVSAESTVKGELVFPAFDPPAEVGKLYTRTWQAPFVNGVTDEWQNRVAGYWERIEQKYGVIISRPVIDYDDATGTITTMATILVVVPGERYSVKDLQ